MTLGTFIFGVICFIIGFFLGMAWIHRDGDTPKDDIM